ncbi:peptidoglycan DD-metalloendopeptidase family protein [Virgibacillus necropolis]|uniref:murein hydrolase activator EnvC family protein n=1 Tax=Virgibacillus necropolis TaxID=163877 RepID=UPI0038502740
MKKNISYVLVAVLLATSTLLNWQSVSASTIDDAKNKVDEIESKQEKLNEKQSDIKKKKEKTTGKIDKNLSKQEKVTNQIEKITNKLVKTKSSIKGKEKEISETNKEIEKLKVEIKELKKRIKKREDLLKERLRTIQQNGGDMRYIEVILGSQNFGDFVSRSSAVNTIMDQDKNIMATHMAEKKELEKKKKVVVNKKEALEEQKQELVSLKAQLDEQAAKKEDLMAQLEKEHKNLEKNKADLQEQEKDLHAQEAKLQKAMEAAKGEIQRLQQIALQKAKEEKAARQQAANNSSDSNLETLAQTSNPGGFIKPAYGPLTSNFGMRRHPVTGELSGHTGVDINGETGDTVVASISGYAIPVNIHWSYGTHMLLVGEVNGKTYTTLYAHMSQSYIGGGKYVEQGEAIGEIGSTGRSTGSHLHFEIHVGSVYHGASSAINPMNYLN